MNDYERITENMHRAVKLLPTAQEAAERLAKGMQKVFEYNRKPESLGSTDCSEKKAKVT